MLSPRFHLQDCVADGDSLRCIASILLEDSGPPKKRKLDVEYTSAHSQQQRNHFTMSDSINSRAVVESHQKTPEKLSKVDSTAVSQLQESPIIGTVPVEAFHKGLEVTEHSPIALSKTVDVTKSPRVKDTEKPPIMAIKAVKGLENDAGKPLKVRKEPVDELKDLISQVEADPEEVLTESSLDSLTSESEVEEVEESEDIEELEKIEEVLQGTLKKDTQEIESSEDVESVHLASYESIIEEVGNANKVPLEIALKALTQTRTPKPRSFQSLHQISISKKAIVKQTTQENTADTSSGSSSSDSVDSASSAESSSLRPRTVRKKRKSMLLRLAGDGTINN